MPIKFLTLLFLLSLPSLFCFSQTDTIQEVESVSNNNRFYTVGEEKAKVLYRKEFLDKYAFLNGREYKLYHVARKTSPLFNSSFGLDGTVFVNGESYPDVILAYDIFKDALIFITPTRIFNNCNFIELNQLLVDSFFVHVETPSINSTVSHKKNYHFTKISFPEKNNLSMTDGYYEVAYCGEIQLFIHHQAIQVNNQNSDAIQNGIIKYVHRLNKTLYLNGNYYEINKKRKFIKLFPDKRKAIKSKLKSFALRFELLNNEQLIEILQFINSI